MKIEYLIAEYLSVLAALAIEERVQVNRLVLSFATFGISTVAAFLIAKFIAAKLKGSRQFDVTTPAFLQMQLPLNLLTGTALLLTGLITHESTLLLISLLSLAFFVIGTIWIYFSLARLLTNAFESQASLQNAYKNIRGVINPHFLFNVFTSIQAFIWMDDKEKADNLLVLLADVLRYLMKTNHHKVSLKDELWFIDTLAQIDSVQRNIEKRVVIKGDIPERTYIYPYLVFSFIREIFELQANIIDQKSTATIEIQENSIEITIMPGKYWKPKEHRALLKGIADWFKSNLNIGIKWKMDTTKREIKIWIPLKEK